MVPRMATEALNVLARIIAAGSAGIDDINVALIAKVPANTGTTLSWRDYTPRDPGVNTNIRFIYFIFFHYENEIFVAESAKFFHAGFK